MVVPHLDVWLLLFIKENFVTITFGLAILKVIAKATPWAGDDQILQILTGLIGSRTINPKERLK